MPLKKLLQMLDHDGSPRKLEVLHSLNLDGITHIEILPGGYNSDVTAIVSNGRQRVIKITGGKKEALTESEASGLAEDITTYHRLLENAGLRLPALEDMMLLENTTRGGYEIVQIMHHRGGSFEDIFRCGGADDVTRAVREILTELDCIFSRQTATGDLEIGIDPKPNNFTRDADGSLWFVDTMPPRFRKENVALVEYPAPRTTVGYVLGYARHYTIAGVLLILQTHASKLNPRCREIVKREIRTFVRDRFPNAAEELRQNEATVSAIVTDKRLDLLSTMTAADVYRIREIGCEIAAGLRSHHEFLERLFRITHFEDGVADAHLAESVSLLRGALTAVP